MAEVKRHLTEEQIAWVASQMKPRSLGKSVFKELVASMVLTVTNGNPVSATAVQLAGNIAEIEVVLNGNDTLISVPFEHLYFQNYYDYAKEPENTIDTTVDTAGVTDEMTVRIPFAMTRAGSPMDTILDARGLSSIVLKCTWADNSFGTGKTITAGNLEIVPIEYAVTPEWPAGALRNIPPASARLEYGYMQASLNKTGEVKVDLDYKGNNQYKRLFIYTYDENSALSNSEISNVKLQARTFVYHDLPSDTLQKINAGDYSISPQTGVYVLDLTDFGLMTQRLDARDLNELKLVLTSAVTDGTVKVVTEKVIYA